MSDDIKKDLQVYTTHIKQFCMASNFQKMILSMIVGMRKQKEELNNLSAVFKMLDKDNDGTLSMEELRSGLENNNLFELLRKDYSCELDDKQLLNDEFELILEALDTDKDGKIDYNEFLQATIDAQSNLNQTTIKEMFNMFDIDKDGTIDRNELQQIFSKEKAGIFKTFSSQQKSQGNGTDDESDIIMEIMREVDKNNDNIITYEEFNEALTKRLRDGI